MIFEEIIELISNAKEKVILIENFNGGKARFNNVAITNNKTFSVWSESDFSEYIIQAYLEKTELIEFLGVDYDVFVFTNFEFLTNKSIHIKEFEVLIDGVLTTGKTIVLTCTGNIAEEFDLILRKYPSDDVLRIKLTPNIKFIVDLYADKISKMIFNLNNAYCKPIDDIFSTPFLNPYEGNEQIVDKLEALYYEFAAALHCEMNTEAYINPIQKLYNVYCELKKEYTETQEKLNIILPELNLETEEHEQIASWVSQIINSLHSEKKDIIPDCIKMILEECSLPNKYSIDFTKPLKGQITQNAGEILKECVYYYF